MLCGIFAKVSLTVVEFVSNSVLMFRQFGALHLAAVENLEIACLLGREIFGLAETIFFSETVAEAVSVVSLVNKICRNRACCGALCSLCIDVDL